MTAAIHKRSVAVLGATGSVGLSTLDVIRRHPERFSVSGLGGWTNVERIATLSNEFRPKMIGVSDFEESSLRQALPGDLATQIVSGSAGTEYLARQEEASIVVAGISGSAGLKPIFSALSSGKTVLIANKEPLVMCGELLKDVARKSNAVLLPVDSEHNAVFQCLPEDHQTGVSQSVGVAQGLAPRIRQITLTASGGPFLRTPASDLKHVTKSQALRHPTWKMGEKITVDSATLMNKGLELIEACRLFDLPQSQVEVVVHPQSVIHALVHYLDGSVLAHLAQADMRIPIAHALSYPDRIDSGAKPLDIVSISNLQFEAPDLDRFPCLSLARQAAEAGGAMPAVLNAANEVAVDAFLNEKIRFIDIPSLISKVMDKFSPEVPINLDEVLLVDQSARKIAYKVLKNTFQS